MRVQELILIHGEALTDLILDHPLHTTREIVIIPSDRVTEFHGTGVCSVHPAHDLESLRLAIVSKFLYVRNSESQRKGI